VLGLWGSGACQHRPMSTSRVLQVRPSSSAQVSAEDMRDGIRIVFDRPTAPPTLIGEPLKELAVSVEPAVLGESRWLDAKTLAFFPKEKLRPSTSYTIRLGVGLHTTADTEVEAWKGATFVHDRIDIAQVQFEGDRDYVAVRPVLTVVATHGVTPSEAVSACAFHERRPDGSLGHSVAAALARSTSPATDEPSSPTEEAQGGGARRIAMAPAKDLQPSTGYVFRCGEGFKAAAGNVGLAKPHDEPLTVHGPAGVKKISPSGNDIAADGVKIVVEFMTPMDPAVVRAHVTLAPKNGAPQPLDLTGDSAQVKFSWSGDLETNTDYEVHVDGALKDVFGQAIENETRHPFNIGDASPRLRTQRGIYVVEKASGRYPVFTRNLLSFDLRCARVSEAKLVSVLTGPENYDAWWDAAHEQIDYDKLGLHLRSKTIKPDAARNRWHDDSVDLGAACGNGEAAGTYILEMTTDAEHGANGNMQRRGRRSLASVTDLGLLAKMGNASSLVWVVRLSTGEPVPNATVKIRDLAGKVRFSGKTDADGVVTAPGASKLVGVKPVGGGEAPADDDEGGGDWADYRARRAIVTAQDGDDLAVLDTSWNNGIQVWNFAVTEDRRGGDVRVRGFLHSDRGLYRPGDTVHLHGLARVVSVSGAMTLPRKRKIHIVVSDPRGSAVVEKDVALTAFGGFSLDVPTAAEARLGDYRVRGQLEDQTFSDAFSVEEYRPRTFEVKVKTPRKNTVIGRALKFELAASYLYGSPLRAGKVTWNVRRRLHVARFPGFDEYVFQDMTELIDDGRWWARNEERSFSQPVADGDVQLDDAGKATIAARDDDADGKQPQDYLFEATVEDASGQAVTTGTTITGHVSDLYLGLHPSEYVQAVDMPFGVQVVGFNREGARRAAQAELTLTRRTYDCGAHGPNGYWSCARNDDKEPVLRRTVAVAESGSAAVERVVLKDPGQYVVRVTASDGHGHTATTSDEVYVIGPGEAFWSGDEGDRMTLIASKARYQPGETARLVPQARLPGAYALATLERDGILWHKVQRLATSGEAVEVPVDARLAPNAFASVALVRGRVGEGHAGRPQFKMGLVNLEVDSSSKRLNVEVATEREGYRPGEKVTARLKVTDASGAPVRAELAVAVADEGVLQIKGYKTPDPMAAFYAPWGLGVESSTTWNRILRRLDPTSNDEDEEGGDAGGDEAGVIRSRFMATAFWAPAVVTGNDGTASVTFTAPDNLTAFRVMAVGADVGERFGSGEHRFTISKQLQAVPALPRFLTVGDEAQAAVLLSNNTKAPFEASVHLRAEGATLRGRDVETVKLAPGSSTRVAFAIAGAEEGRAKLVFKVTGGGYADAVLAELPVERPSVPESIVVGDGVARGPATFTLPNLGAIVPGHGDLEISLDTTGLSRLDEGLRYLVGYPYGCLEQTTSKIVPMVALTELARTVPLPGVSSGKAKAFVEAGIAKIGRHQHDDGGFGLWIGTPPEAHYTAYALWGLMLARDAGYHVDERVVTSGLGYLKRYVDAHAQTGASAAEIAGAEGDRAFAHYVLAALGQPVAGSLSQLFEHRSQLPIYGKAFLARGLFKAGSTDLAHTVIAELVAAIPGAGQTAIIREGQRELGYYWSSDLRTTALVLSALLEITPAEPSIHRLEEALLGARVDGRWSNTQENVYALVALASVAKSRAANGDASVLVGLGDAASQQLVVRAGAIERLRFPIEKLVAGAKLTIDGGARDLFYAARIHVERPLGGAMVDRGLAVSREYLDPDTSAPVSQIRLGQTIKVRVTVRSPVRRAHVVLVDRLPAAFEPVLTRFRSSYAGDEARPWSSFWWWQEQTAWQNLEQRDDRVQLFADVLVSGQSQQEYLVRATAVGSFAAPPITAEAMYEPTVTGRSVAGKVVVQR
jgi:uncharacterized protein YfaS (alpha-2-macroglobulin family)